MYGSTKKQAEDIALVKKGDSIINMGPFFDEPDDESEQDRLERLERINEFMKNPFRDEKGSPEFWKTVCNYFLVSIIDTL